MNTNDTNEKGHDQAVTSMTDKELDAVVGGKGGKIGGPIAELLKKPIAMLIDYLFKR